MIDRSPPTPMKPSVAVVGIGNRLVFCDQIGTRVLDDCRARYGPEVELLDAGTASFSLLDCMRCQDLMLIVDACCMGENPGEIRVEEMDSAEDPTPGTDLHQIGPLETFAIAAKLFPEILPLRTLLIMVETEGIEEMDMQKASRQVVSIIDREVARCLAKSGKGVKLG